MKILVLNRNSLVEREYARWIGPGHQVVLITDAKALPPDESLRAQILAAYDHVEVLTNFHANAAVELLACRLHERYRFDLLVGLNEYEIVRSARLRSKLGIPGQLPASAQAFRDKLHMKNHLRRAGVPVADYGEVGTITDILDFVAEHRYPIVVKPRTAAGSVGVSVLRDETDLERYAERSADLGADDRAYLLAEKYIEHELMHVDGIVVDGVCRLVWPSTFGDTGCLDPMEGRPLISTMLEPSDPVFDASVELTHRALAALPSPQTFIFHAEIFNTAGGLVFNEVACRMGGTQIEPTLLRAFGTRLTEVYVRAVADNDPPVLPGTPSAAFGYASVPPRPAVVAGIPGSCPVEGIVDYHRHAEVGDVLGSAKLSVDKIATFIAQGADRPEVLKRLEQAVEWFDDHTQLETVSG